MDETRSVTVETQGDGAKMRADRRLVVGASVVLAAIGVALIVGSWAGLRVRVPQWPTSYTALLFGSVLMVGLVGLLLRRTLSGALRALARSAEALPRLTCGLLIGTAVVWCSLAGQLQKPLHQGNPDLSGYLFGAQLLASGRLKVASPPNAEFFEQFMVMARDGKRFSRYSPGAGIVQAVGLALVRDYRPSVTLTLAFGLLALFGLVRRHLGVRPALVALLLAVTSPYVLHYGLTPMSPGPAFAFFTGSLWAFSEARDSRHWGWRVLLILCIVMLMLTRPMDGAILVGVIGAYALVFRDGATWRRALPWAVVGGAVGIALLLSYNWTMTGHPLAFPFSEYSPQDRIGFGERGLLDLHPLRQFTVAGALANIPYEFGSWLSRLTAVLHVADLGPRLGLSLLAGKPGVWLERLVGMALSALLLGVYLLSRADTESKRRAKVLFITVVAGYAVGYALYWARTKYYLFPAGGLGLMAVGSALASGLRSRRWGRVTAIGLLVIVVVNLSLMGSITYPKREVDFQRELEALGREEPIVVLLPAEPTTKLDWSGRHTSRRRVGWPDKHKLNKPGLAGNVVYAVDLGEEKNRTLYRMYPTRRVYRLSVDQRLTLAR